MHDSATLTSKTLIISMFSVSHFRCRKANIFQISYGGSATRSTVPSTSRFTPSASALIELRSKAIWSGVSRAESVQASDFAAAVTSSFVGCLRHATCKGGRLFVSTKRRRGGLISAK